MIALAPREAKQTLFEDRVASVPHCQGKTNQLMAVGNPHDSVLAPAIGAGTGVVMRKEIPCGAVRAVILTHRSPLAFGEIRSPTFPVHFALARFFEAFFFSIHHWSLVLPRTRNHQLAKQERDLLCVILDLLQPLPSWMGTLHLMKSQLAVPDYRGNSIRELVNQVPAELFALSL